MNMNLTFGDRRNSIFIGEVVPSRISSSVKGSLHCFYLFLKRIYKLLIVPDSADPMDGFAGSCDEFITYHLIRVLA